MSGDATGAGTSDPRAADWLDAEEARRIMVDGVQPLAAHTRPLLDARGFVLAEDVVSSVDLPPWDNSAMDGFAVRAQDVRGASAAAPRTLRVVDDVPAGRFASRPVGPREATRIMTGAPVPGGADGVIRVEHTDGGSGMGGPDARVVVRTDEDAGRNVRPRGEDVRAGAVVLAKGTVIRPAEIGVAASVGHATLSVVRRPVVAVLTSGDELVHLDGFAEVRAGRRIVSSSTYALAASLAECGMEVRLLGIAADRPESLREHLEQAHGCDAVITSAGISVGVHDHVLGVMRDLRTEIAFWRVRIRPGSAMAFGRVGALGGIPWFGLPGNPVSTAVCFDLFVRPALLRMAGHTRIHLPVAPAVLRDDYRAKPGLMLFPRVRLTRDADGTLSAHLTGSQSSGVASSLAAADALLAIPADHPGAG
ncbi:MAG TPA: gephyrin-like molybdotransferase Glp, partial [Longimicrobiaceae bacterium]|nr:gephyrin-like molybdotransferase Glp [Longimicrobiaceae bacterium]